MKIKYIYILAGFLFPFSFIQGQCDMGLMPSGYKVPNCATGTYTLVFEDNFNGSTLDLTKWKLPENYQGSLLTSETKDVRTLNNAIVNNGSLFLEAREETVLKKVNNKDSANKIMSDGSPNERIYQYTGAEIWTKEKFFYGKFETRCRISKSRGIWPSFWTFGGQNKWNELDIFEIFYDKDSPNAWTYTNNIHYDLNNDGDALAANESCHGSSIPWDIENWHTYTCIYDVDKIVLLVDNVVIRTIYRYYDNFNLPLACGSNSNDVNQINAFPRDKMNIIFSMWVLRGTHAPHPTPPLGTPFEATYEIDYVRFWEKDPIIPCDNDLTKTLPFSGVYECTNAYLSNTASVTSIADITAANTIHMQSGFSVLAGKIYHAKADPYLCAATYRWFNEQEAQKESEIIAARSLSIYPNPHNGQFNVSIDNEGGAVTIQVFDIMGKQVYSENAMNNAFSIDISDQPKGVYLVKLTVGDQLFTEKIIYQ